MKKETIRLISFLLFAFLLAPEIKGQEHKGPLAWNPALFGQPPPVRAAQKTTALSLPFFEDFTDYSIYPNPGQWMEHQVYINNTMCVNPISRGVATFDALNEKGLPWDPTNNSNFGYADSLTSRPIDLSTHTPGDSLYLSFFYQPQGNGFFPVIADTLFVFMKIKYGDWFPVWKMPGSRLQPFKQAMVPITDTLYFHGDFQFRFVNIAALNWSDAIWNVDYVRLGASRNLYDTAVNDVAFGSDPGFILNDYASMPYRQFMANAAGERAGFVTDSIRNNTFSSQPLSHSFTATAPSSGALLQAPVTKNVTVATVTTLGITDSVYTATVPMPGIHDKVVFENKFYIAQTAATGPVANDTIVKPQVFDNDLAYDDGTAEQSYYLTLYPSLPGKIEIEHHVNVADTLRGMAIYFGRQVPAASYKYFDIEVYTALAGVNGAAADRNIYRQLSCTPGYIDTINHFWIYKFDNPVPVQPGTFYTGIFLPAASGDDSIYFGLDMNRVGSNHAYYSVANAWNPSLIHGAIMMRPLLGKEVTSSGIPAATLAPAVKWNVAPVPASDYLHCYFPGDDVADYFITDIAGRNIGKGAVQPGKQIDLSGLQPGLYFINIEVNGAAGTPQKFIKL